MTSIKNSRLGDSYNKLHRPFNPALRDFAISDCTDAPNVVFPTTNTVIPAVVKGIILPKLKYCDNHNPKKTCFIPSIQYTAMQYTVYKHRDCWIFKTGFLIYGLRFKESDMDFNNWRTQLRKGLLEMAVINLLQNGKIHGYEMVQKLKQLKGLKIREGNIYAILGRLRIDGVVKSSEGSTENGPPRNFFELTKKDG